MGLRRSVPLLLVLALVAGACRPPVGEEISAPAPAGELDEALRDLAELPDAAQAAALAGRMAATGDVRWIPYLLDLLRIFGLVAGADFFGTGPDAYLAALEDLTGLPSPADPAAAFVAYGTWALDRRPDPGPAYPSWKAQLYRHIDPGFEALLGSVDDPRLAAELQWGGVVRGGIPELNDPALLSPEEAGYLAADELVFGAWVGGEPRAYPLRILDFHELANDRLGGEPVVLANCTLCRSGLLYSRAVGSRVLDFQTSGLLRLSNKVMVDRQTDTLWDQLTGEALAGPLAGKRLERRTLVTTTWEDWLADHPRTTVLAIPIREGEPPVTGGYSYQPGDAYRDYYASAGLWFPAPEPPPVFAPKQLVGTIEVEGAALAVDLEALGEAGPTVLSLGGARVVAVPTVRAGARFYGPVQEAPSLASLRIFEDRLVLANGTRLTRLESGTAFWFAWYARHPQTAWWPEG